MQFLGFTYRRSKNYLQRKENKSENEVGHLKKLDFKVLDIEETERFLENLKKSNTSLNRTSSFGSLNSSLQKISTEQE